MTSQPASDAPRLTPRFVLQAAAGSLVALAIVAAAVAPRIGTLRPPAFRPHLPDLGLVAAAPPAIQIHLAAVVIAFAIGVALMLGVKGARRHRLLGWTWVLAMAVGAVSSFFIREANHGSLSLIHLLSGWTVVALPMAVFAARRRKAKLHARVMTGLFTGGLLLAGLLAFAPGRLMWRVFLG